jgi:hypothetical protein
LVRIPKGNRRAKGKTRKRNTKSERKIKIYEKKRSECVVLFFYFLKMLLTDLVKDTRGFKTVNKMKKINKDIRYIKKNDLAETIDNVKMDNSVSFFDMREEIRLSFVNIFNNRREEMNEELAEKL